jgi:hypothetical protein
MPRPPFRIAVLQFVHETVTFLRSDTTIDDYTFAGSPAGGEALLAADPNPISAVSCRSPASSTRSSGWVNTFVYFTKNNGELNALYEKWFHKPLPNLPAL